MKQWSKRIISFLLAFVLLIGAVPVNAAASETEPTVIPEETTAPTAETTAPAEEPTVPAEVTAIPTEEAQQPAGLSDENPDVEGILVNETNFPDANFRSYIWNQPYGSDGVLTDTELAAATNIVVSEAGIASLKGIEHFHALTTLICYGNPLTALDVSSNTQLTQLISSNCQLTSLDISANTQLVALVCNGNPLTSLDVSANRELMILHCGGSQLTQLNVRNNTKLTELGCDESQLTALDVSQNTSLQKLNCGGNQLTALDVSSNTQLTSLYCFANRLTSLDLSNNSALTECHCNNNSRAITVDTSNQFDLSTLPGFDVTKASGWEGGSVSGSTLTATSETITYTYDLGNGTTETFTLTTTLNVEISTQGLLVNETNFPDENFRNRLLQTRYGHDGVLTATELETLSSLDLSNGGISDLTGISYFTGLKVLNCDFNQLTELDVSNHTELTELHCNNNNLTALDVSKNTQLTQLRCYNNQLTELDVSKNTKLTWLECSSNQLTVLDLSNNLLLKTLYCGDNQLTKLDVRNHSALFTLDCTGNHLTSLDVSRNTGLDNLQCFGNTRVIELTRNNEFDLRTLPDFDVSRASNWVGGTVSNYTLKATDETITYTYDLGNGTTETFKLTTKLNSNVQVIADFFPDAKFQEYLLDQSYGADGVITAEELAAVTEINVADLGIASLKGIEHFPALTTLICYGNPLTALDVSKNTQLTQLISSNCQLTALDVSANTALTTLICNGNPLTSLDVSANRELMILHCGGSQLTQLNVRNNTKLTELGCDESQLTQLNVSNNTELQKLNCGGNQLTELDVSKNTKLTTLYCFDNRLTSLDLSSNSALTECHCNNNSHAITVDANNQFDLSTLPGFDVTKASGWEGGSVSGSTLTATAETITYTYDLGNGTTETFTLTTTLNEDTPDGVQVNEENFPDANFRKYILAQTYGADGVLTEEELADVDYMSVTGKGFASLKGIEHFTALTYLYCSNNRLSTLDVSNHPALTNLVCSNNHLTTLDVSSNPVLKQLHCNNNQLTTLDVSSNPELMDFSCSDNQLTTLDVSGNPALENLYCNWNQLSALDMSNNPTLKLLSCISNQLTSLDVSGNPALTDLYCGVNQLSALDVSSNPALTNLGCGNNLLTSLDLSNNSVLTTCDCNNNQLTALNVSSNPALTDLLCYRNLLTELDVSRNTALMVLWCDSNQLASLDLRNNPQCTNIAAYSNRKTITVNSENKFDLSTLPGFDVTRASSWKGGTISGNTLTATSKTITYTYDLGNGTTETFTLSAGNYVPKTLKAPVIKVSNDPATGKPKLTWEAADGAVKYQVWRATSKNGKYTLMKTVTDTSYINNSAKTNTLYYYKVRSVGAAGKFSKYSNILSRRCDLPRPGITVSGVSSTGKIKVSWKAISGAKSYQVWRATSENGTYSLMKTTTSTSYTNTSAKAGQTYYYKVRAIHSNTNANSAYSLVKSRTCDLARPTVTLSSVASTGRIKVSWKAISGAVSYDIYRATGKNGTYSLVNNVTGTSFTDNETAAGKTYYYQVVAVHSNTNANSAKSTAVSRVCDLARPDVTISLSSKGKPKLTWEGIEGATKYEVYRATSKTGKYTLVKTTTGTSFTNTGAKKGTTYFFKVKAIHSNTNANSAYSLVDSIRSK